MESIDIEESDVSVSFFGKNMAKNKRFRVIRNVVVDVYGHDY